MYKLGRSRALGTALRAVRVCADLPELRVLSLTDTSSRCGAQSYSNSNGTSAYTNTYQRACLNRYGSSLSCAVDLAYNGQYGIGVPNGEVAKTAEEAEAIAKKIGMKYTCAERYVLVLTIDRWR